MYVYVYIYIYISMYIYIYTHICTNVYIYIYIHNLSKQETSLSKRKHARNQSGVRGKAAFV